MIPYLSLVRPSVCLMSVLGIVVGSIVSGTLAAPFLVALASIAAFIITGAGNVINDYFDVETDRINAPHRPLPAGQIRRQQAFLYFLALVAAGLAFAAAISPPFFTIAAINVVVLSVYSWKLKTAPFVGNLAVSWLAASSFLAAPLILRGFSSLLELPILLLSLIAFLGSLSREILKDIRDMEGDKQIQARTLPLVIGADRTAMIGKGILLVAALLLILPAALSLFGVLYYPLAGLAVLLSLLALTKPPAQAEKLIKIAIFVVFAAFIGGTVV